MKASELSNILLQLKSEAIAVQKGTKTVYELKEKYGVAFLRHDFGVIQSIDLPQVVKVIMGIDVSQDEIHAILLDACALTNMRLEPLAKLFDPGSEDAQYLIELTMA